MDAPVTIRGDSSFLGQVSVKATRQTERLYHATMDGPCLTITGSFFLHPGARLHFESCRNGQSTSEGSLGGGLRVDADMDLRGGHLRFENCRADGDEIITGAGGAIYVGGARAPKAAPKARLLTCGGHFRNKNSTIEACNCSGTTGGAPKDRWPMVAKKLPARNTRSSASMPRSLDSEHSSQGTSWLVTFPGEALEPCSAGNQGQLSIWGVGSVDHIFGQAPSEQQRWRYQAGANENQ